MRGASSAGEHSSGAVGILQALAAAVLFGLASPIAKLLLAGATPIMLAGLLYLGAGVGLAVWWLLKRGSRGAAGRREASLTASDLPSLGGAVLFGGVIGPVLQMVGLSTTPASTAALLLNMEVVFTALIAWFVFKEHFDRRIGVGMASVVAGGTLLSWTGHVDAVPWGSLAIIGACAAWGIDNNVTRRISNRDPIQVAAVKGLVAGSCNVAIGLGTGGSLPAPSYLVGSALLGVSAYGVSLVLFVLALRHIGAARTAAHFALAPFVGAIVALAALGERPTVLMVVAAILMAAGIYIHVSERHVHEHEHADFEHDHRHVHDAHHQHEHAPGDPPGEPHAHPHRHARLTHAHRHFPDAHHGHQH